MDFEFFIIIDFSFPSKILPTKLTISRIIFTIMIIVLFLFPFYQMNLEFPMWALNLGKEVLEIDSRYIIGGILFVIASLTDFLDGYLARKYHLVTTYGKFMDPIADKLLVDTVVINYICCRRCY